MDWLCSKALELLLEMELPTEGHKEEQQGTAQGLPRGSAFTSLGISEISPWVLESRAPRGLRVEALRTAHSPVERALPWHIHMAYIFPWAFPFPGDA